jgi:hypothetical protein
MIWVQISFKIKIRGGNINMKITAEFNSVEELSSFINTFGTNTIGAIAAKQSTVVVAATESKKAIKSEDKPKEKIKDEVPKDDAKENVPSKEADTSGEVSKGEEPPKGDPKITKEMVREVFTKIIKAGKQSEAKALTSKYGAAKLPEVKEEDYAAIFKEAEGLI